MQPYSGTLWEVALGNPDRFVESELPCGKDVLAETSFYWSAFGNEFDARSPTPWDLDRFGR